MTYNEIDDKIQICKNKTDKNQLLSFDEILELSNIPFACLSDENCAKLVSILFQTNKDIKQGKLGKSFLHNVIQNTEKIKLSIRNFDNSRNEVFEFDYENISTINPDFELTRFRIELLDRTVKTILNSLSSKYAPDFQFKSKYSDTIVKNIGVKHPPKSDPELGEYFHLDDGIKSSFIQDIKLIFNTEKGKAMRALIEVLKDKSIVIIPNRMNKPLYRVLQKYLNRDIADYNALFDKSVSILDYDKNFIYEKLDPLLKKYKLNKN